MNFLENWVENDLNPIITFSSSGRVIYLNQNGQFLLDAVSFKKLYETAIKYAPKTYGFQTSYINLSFKNWIFYAISVGYEDDEKLYVKFYRSINVKQEENIIISNSSLTNLFTIVDLNISNQKANNQKIKFIKDYDPSIPEFSLDAPNLVKTISKAYEHFENSKNIKTSVKLKLGEYIKIDNKKYSLVTIYIQSDGILKQEEIKPTSTSFILKVENNSICIDLPIILPSS